MPKNLFLLFLLVACPIFLVAQEGITIEESSIRISRLLKQISKQSGVDFSYNSKAVNTKTKIDFAIQNASLEATLDLLGQKIGVDYLEVDGQIVLKASKENIEEPLESEYVLSGFLSDESTGENLIGASVAVLGTGKGTFTNEFGFYSLKLERGRHTISYSYVGFEPIKEEVNLEKNIRKTIALPPVPLDLPEVLVGRPLQEIQSRNGLGNLNIDPEKLNNLPEFGGESGLVKGLQSLPGIQTHSDGSAFFYTRGGERDQNLLIIDDAPIYNPSHLFGFYSIVLPDFSKQITVHKSNLPASMGDRLSSIVSIRTKDGNLNKAELNGAINPLINSLAVSTPLFKKRSAMFLSMRHSNLDWLTQNVNTNADIRFWDFHFKWNYRINENNRLYFTSIRSGDVFANTLSPVNGIRWGNTAATIRWNSIYSPKLFSNLILYSGNYAYNLGSSTEFWKSELGTISLKMDFTHYASDRYTGKFGFENQSFFFTPGQVSLDSSLAVLPDIDSDQSRKNVLYYQGEFKIGNRLNLNLGFRLINWLNQGPKTYFEFDENYEPIDTITVTGGFYNRFTNLDPRFNLQFQLDSTSMLSFSLGSYHQYLQLIQNSISPFTAFEVWLPAGPNIEPQAARQLTLNYQKYFAKSKTSLGSSVYYKISDNQIDYVAHATTYLNPLIESELRFGQARSYGIELLFKKDFGKLNGWVKYVYSRVFRNTQDLNKGAWYPAFQDRPHDFAMVLNYDISKRISTTAFWTSRSGSTFTSPVGFYEFNGQLVPLFGSRNNDRLPAYHRLDLSVRFQLHKKSDAKYQHHLVFSIYNALAHKNVFVVKFNKEFSENYFPRVPINTFDHPLRSPSQIDLIRFFPSLTYKFKI